MHASSSVTISRNPQAVSTYHTIILEVSFLLHRMQHVVEYDKFGQF
jgi:hypothetical protein